jgi:thiol:disulfide interchange protein
MILLGNLAACAQISAPPQMQTNSAAVPLPSPQVRETFDPARNPAEDLQTAIATAQKSNKRIILDVGGEWCGWCRNMDNLFLRNAELAQLLDANFIWLKVNVSPENKNETFLADYPKISGYPHLFVLDGDGKLLQSKNTSELENGKTYDAAKFTEFLKANAPEK